MTKLGLLSVLLPAFLLILILDPDSQSPSIQYGHKNSRNNAISPEVSALLAEKDASPIRFSLHK